MVLFVKMQGEKISTSSIAFVFILLSVQAMREIFTLPVSSLVTSHARSSQHSATLNMYYKSISMQNLKNSIRFLQKRIPSSMNIEIIAGALYRLQRETRCQMSFFVFHREIDSALGLNTCMNTTNLQGEEKVVFTDASVWSLDFH